MEVIEYIGIISIFNLLILSLYLFIKRSKTPKRNNILCILTLSVAYTQFLYILYLSGHIRNLPFLTYTDSISISIFMPAFYLYISALTENREPFEIRNIKHLIPVIPGTFYCIYFNSLPIDIQQKCLVMKTCGDIPDLYLYLIGGLLQQTYCFLSIRKLNEFYIPHKHILSKADKNEFIWHYVLAFGFFILSISFIALYAIISKEYILELISSIYLDILFLFIIIFLLIRPSNYSFDITPFEKDNKNTVTSEIKKSPELINYIEKEISNRKLFLENNITIARLAKLLSIPEYKLSQSVNQEYGMSVPEYLNHLRIEFAKEKLMETGSSKIKLDYLAKECGFNTRTSFYAAFKKFTNCTPAQFREQRAT